MRVVVVGGTGQLGRELARVLPGADTVVLSRAELDLTDPAAVAPRLAALAPSAVVNAAADNRVDAAEQDPAPAMAVNALGAGALAPRHAVVRLAALYAAGGAGFVDRVLTRARAGGRLRVVHDQVTAPTWARDVATARAPRSPWPAWTPRSSRSPAPSWRRPRRAQPTPCSPTRAWRRSASPRCVRGRTPWPRT